MKAPIGNLKKQEIINLYKGICKHGHRYLEHYQCYLAEKPEEAHVKIGFFDIETSNFKADWAIMLTYSLLDNDSGRIYGRAVTPNELGTKIYDRNLSAELVDDLRRFDLIVGYYSDKFDIPFSRTRTVINGLDYPTFGELQHKDIYYAVRAKFGALSSRRQENAARMLVGKTEKTHINPKIWMDALIAHDKAALAWIFDHNNRDVRDLRDIYWKVIPYVKNITKSI